MSTAKLQVMEILQQIPDTINDEFQVVDDLYKLLKLRKSQNSIKEQGTMTTDEVKDHFKARRRRMAAE